MKKLTIIVTFILVVLISGCKSQDQILSERMIEKYSNDANYVRFMGEVVSFDEDAGTVIINSKELIEKQVSANGIYKFCIYGENDNFTLNVDDEIEFLTVPFHFYNGHVLPIVEVVLNGNVLLEFEEGKEALIDWAVWYGN